MGKPTGKGGKSPGKGGAGRPSASSPGGGIPKHKLAIQKGKAGKQKGGGPQGRGSDAPKPRGPGGRPAGAQPKQEAGPKKRKPRAKKGPGEAPAKAPAAEESDEDLPMSDEDDVDAVPAFLAGSAIPNIMTYKERKKALSRREKKRKAEGGEEGEDEDGEEGGAFEGPRPKAKTWDEAEKERAPRLPIRNASGALVAPPQPAAAEARGPKGRPQPRPAPKQKQEEEEEEEGEDEGSGGEDEGGMDKDEDGPGSGAEESGDEDEEEGDEDGEEEEGSEGDAAPAVRQRAVPPPSERESGARAPARLHALRPSLKEAAEFAAEQDRVEKAKMRMALLCTAIVEEPEKNVRPPAPGPSPPEKNARSSRPSTRLAPRSPPTPLAPRSIAGATLAAAPVRSAHQEAERGVRAGGQIKKLNEVHHMLAGGEPSPAVRRLALLSELDVLRDVIPGYRIRPPTAKELEVRAGREREGRG
eukprot:tig00020693_g13014.t1